MGDWLNIPVKERIGLLREYKKLGYSYSNAKKDFEDSLPKYEGGETLTPQIPNQQPASSTNVVGRNPMYEMQLMERDQLRQNLFQQASQGSPEAEQQFRETFGTSTHRYRYDNDPQYREQTQTNMREYTGAKIDYPSTDLRREGNVSPNNAWMYPQLQGKGKQAMTNFSNEVIAAATPIPILEPMGKIPSALQVVKKAGKVANKADDIVKYYHGGLGDEIKTIDDIDLFRTSIKQNKKGRDYSGFYLYDEAEKAGATAYAEQTGKNLHEFSISKNAKIKELPNIERVTKQDLQKYLDEGYDMIKGTDVRGRQEFVLLNKEKVISTSSSKPFKSEIDWAKWNPDTPKYPELINEYNAIEEGTKKAGTWMKNPDGSVFQGTPEQFVQQQSTPFKKAFGDSKLLNADGSPMKVYHGSAKKFDTFDESKFQLGDSGYSGKGIYTTPSKTTADSYALSSGSFHSGEKIPTTYELYGRANKPIRSSELPEGYDLFDFYREKNWQGDVPIQRQLRDYDAAIANKRGMIDRIYPDRDAAEIVFPTNKQLKSAIGNNGMFDMTNPNIYKGLIPPAIGLGVGSQYLQEKEFGGVIPIEPLKRRRR